MHKTIELPYWDAHSQWLHEQWQEKARAELRDRFAMAALTGFLAGDHRIASDVARWSYEYADAMLKARGDG